MPRKRLVEIEGVKYEITSSLGFVHDVGGWVKFVRDGERNRAIIRHRGAKQWRFRTPVEVVQPLRDALIAEARRRKRGGN